MPKKSSAATTTKPRPRLAAARYQRGWSQQELAALLGTTPLNVSRWERGLTTPSPYFRQQLARVFGIHLQELDGLIAATSSLPEQQALRPQGGASQALFDPSIPLPTGLLPLVGREEELSRLKQRLRTSQKVALSALGGLPGVGKTALALALVYDPEVRAHFADGILWAGLGPEANLLNTFARWGRLLGLSQSDASKLVTLEQWTNTLRAMIGQRRMLVVLDDTWNIEDALACLVGGPNCAYLLTTRVPRVALSFAATDLLIVPELNEEQSLRLLHHLAPEVVEREAEAVRRLVRLVGGLPLALSLMGHYLRLQAYSGQPRRIRAAINRLHSTEARLQLAEARPLLGATPALPDHPISLQAMIAISEQRLTQRARAALRALSVFPAKPHSFAEEAALAVSQQPVEALDELNDAGLVESVGPGRYSLHQTIADYARLQQQETDPKQQLMAYSVSYAQEHESDFAALQQESSMLLAALQASVELERGMELVRMCLVLAPLWKAHGEYALAEQYLPRALAVAQHREQTQVLLLMGTIAHLRSDYAQAEERYQQALALARQQGNQELVCETLGGLSWATLKKGDFVRPEAWLQEGLEVARREGYVRQQANLLRVLGTVMYEQGKIEQSIVYMREGVTLARQISDHELTCILLNNLGATIMDTTGDFTQSMSYFQEGLKLARQMGYRQWESLLLANLAHNARVRGEYKQAEGYLQEGLALAQQIGSLERMCNALLNLGEAVIQLGEYEQAERYLQEGLALARQIGHINYQASLLTNLGDIATQRGEYEQAEGYLQEGLTLARQAGILSRHSELLSVMAEALIVQGKYEQAEDYLQEGLALAQQIGNPTSTSLFLASLAEALIAQGKYEQAERYLQEGLALARQSQQRPELCKILSHWGELHLQRRLIEQAARIFEELQVTIPQGARREQARALYGLARVAAAQEDRARARQLGTASLALLEAIRHRQAQEVRHWLSALDESSEKTK